MKKLMEIFLCIIIANVIFKLAIPNALKTCSENNENLQLNEKSIKNYVEIHCKIGINLIICQKIISQSLKKCLKVINTKNYGIKYIEKIGITNSEYLSRITKKSPESSFYLINESFINKLEISSLINNKQYILIHADNILSILFYSLLHEDYNYICNCFDCSFKVFKI